MLRTVSMNLRFVLGVPQVLASVLEMYRLSVVTKAERVQGRREEIKGRIIWWVSRSRTGAIRGGSSDINNTEMMYHKA